MIRLFDTHAHVYVNHFAEDRSDMIARAREKGVEHIVMPNIDVDSWQDAVDMEDEFPDICHLSIGLHPCSVKDDFEAVLNFFEKKLPERSYAAIGETGIDLYWDKSTYEIQCDAFARQIEWAKDLGIPLIIHSRDSLEQTIELVEKHQDGRLQPIFHCFTGDEVQGKRIQDVGGYMGIGGVLTYKNGGLKPVMAGLDLDRLILETDAPYLPPTPHRGKRNEPAYVIFVLRHLADTLGIVEEELSVILYENAHNLFRKYLKNK